MGGELDNNEDYEYKHSQCLDISMVIAKKRSIQCHDLGYKMYACVGSP